jgi:hypothetical protein
MKRLAEGRYYSSKRLSTTFVLVLSIQYDGGGGDGRSHLIGPGWSADDHCVRVQRGRVQHIEQPAAALHASMLILCEYLYAGICP